IKATRELIDEHGAQVLNYLQATRLPLGISVNFGSHPKLKYKRIALTNSRARSIRGDSRDSRERTS
ncbi:MAG: GxxExxY protein, partial [Planctomycetota bacterium]